MERNKGISIISVNYDVCERILRSKKGKLIAEEAIHGKPISGPWNEKGKTIIDKGTNETENKVVTEKEKQKEKAKEKEKVTEHVAEHAKENFTKNTQIKKNNKNQVPIKKETPTVKNAKHTAMIDREGRGGKGKKEKNGGGAIYGMAYESWNDTINVSPSVVGTGNGTGTGTGTGTGETGTVNENRAENRNGSGNNNRNKNKNKNEKEKEKEKESVSVSVSVSLDGSKIYKRKKSNNAIDKSVKKKSVCLEPVPNELFQEIEKKTQFNEETYAKEQQYMQRGETGMKVSYKRGKTEMMNRGRSCIYNEMTYNEFMHSLKQQRLKQYKKIHCFYEWKTAIIILSICSILFILIGIYIYIESTYVVETSVPYGVNDTYKTFTINETMKKPVYVYYKISNLFTNFKGYVSDQSTYIISESRCKYIKTFEDLYKYRCLGGLQTLPELQLENSFGKKQNSESDNTSETTKNEKIVQGENNRQRNNITLDSCNANDIDPELKTKKIHPCGLVAASVFNDKIALSRNEQILKIEKFSAVKNLDFFTYAKKKKKLQDFQIWLPTVSTEYRNWSHFPMTSSFIKLYGVINEDLEKGTNYKITFHQNAWPSHVWKAEKAFVFASLRSIGNSSKYLAYLYFIIAFIYILIIIFIILLVKCKYYQLGITFSICQTTKSSNNHEESMTKKITKKKKAISLVEGMESANYSDAYTSSDNVNVNPSDVQKLSCPCPLH